MKTKIFGFLALVLGIGFASHSALAIFAQDAKTQALYTKANATDPLPGIGSVINATKNMLRATYDSSVLATSGSVFLVDDHGNTAQLPVGAIVTNVVANVLTAPLPSASTMSLGLLGAADLMAAKANSSMTGFVAGVPVGTAATWVGPVTSTSLNNLGCIPAVNITGSALTAGKVEFFIEYVIQ